MSAKKVRKSIAPPALAKKASAKGRRDKPRIIWALLTREFVTDRATNTMSAIHIVEELHFPLNAFRSPGNFNVAAIEEPISLAFTLDWRWPVLVTASTVQVKVDWHTPSGNAFFADGGNMGTPIAKPSQGFRTHVEMKLPDLPLEEEGIYHFSILLNDEIALEYPVRIRALPIAENSERAKVSRKGNASVRKVTKKAAGRTTRQMGRR
ncbi:MAG TPA: hypothetical protein VM576_00345 [Xanthomonadaceae bacterium]|nr:hypothetical protein [Xanthomonadaceae bacterium]